MSQKQIKRCYFYDSSSGSKQYQTLLFIDGTTSCDCPGWTRRVQPDGSRTCKHTRDVEADGKGYVRVTRYREDNRPMPQPANWTPPAKPMKRSTGTQEPEQPSREFAFD